MIERINIYWASREAMKIAISQLDPPPDYLLIDGNKRIKGLNITQEPVVKGDAKCMAVAAAYIIAKVTRDRLMCCYAMEFPQYRLHEHKGYWTEDHVRLIKEYGPCPIHRLSFNGVKSDRRSK